MAYHYLTTAAIPVGLLGALLGVLFAGGSCAPSVARLVSRPVPEYASAKPVAPLCVHVKLWPPAGASEPRNTWLLQLAVALMFRVRLERFLHTHMCIDQ